MLVVPLSRSTLSSAIELQVDRYQVRSATVATITIVFVLEDRPRRWETRSTLVPSWPETQQFHVTAQIV